MKNPFVVRVGSDQHIGARDSQEDSIGVSDFLNLKFVPHGGVVGILADGMGGTASGKLASETAVAKFLEHYSKKLPSEPIRDALMRALFAANDAVHNIPNTAGPERKAGTTFVAAVIHGLDLHWISVGDTRVYLYRGDTLSQLTTDHTYSTELQRRVQQRIMSAEDAEKHPDRDVLTSYVGHGELSDIDCNIRPTKLELNDVILLCSDGLYRTLDPEDMVESLQGHPQSIAESLVARAIAKRVPGQDNASAVVMFCDENSSGSELEPTTAENNRDFKSASRFIGFLIIIFALAGLAFVLSSMKK